jgi:hypothetical protein
MIMRRLCAALALALAACNNGDICDDKVDDVGDVCIPALLAPDIPILLEAREQCGLTCTGDPVCSALFVNGGVALDVSNQVCQSSQVSICFLGGCQNRVMQCTLPPLPAGNYSLTVPGGPPRLLRVGQGGTASCRYLLDAGT